jgi:CBASS immunity effector Cap15-like protein
MREQIIKALVFLTSIGIIAYILTTQNVAAPGWALLLGILVNIISSPLYFLIIEGLYSLNHLGLFWKTKVIYRNQDVRLSIAYLFRIKVGDDYLLVKNRSNDYYQLVGGAYKTLPSIEKVFKKYKVKPDRKFQTNNGIAKNDLRFSVPGKNVIPMLKWFHSKEDREISQWREFCEELLTSGLVDKHEFRYIDYSYATTLQTPIKKAKKLDMQEILVYEIFDLIPTYSQLQYLENLRAQGNTKEIKWADRLSIQNLGFNEHTKTTAYEIGAHTKWALLEKWTDD